VRLDALSLCRADQGAHLRRGIRRGADFHVTGERDKSIDDLVV
jgi:hypothetical protein